MAQLGQQGQSGQLAQPGQSGQLEGKTAVVTGGGTGIGLATAVRLAAEGAHVFITGRRTAQLDAAVGIIGPGRATAVAGDVSVPADLDRLYDAVRARGRGLDVLFANAASATFATLEQTTEEHFDQTFGVNVRGTLFTVQKALPLLNDGASVILNASTAAGNGKEAFGAYAASKAAVRSYARTWANELKGRGIRVNAVSPGPIDTPGITGLVGEENADRARENLAAGIAIGRMGRPEEVAGVVAFLASEQSSFVLGANWYVDGGENQI
ncbi:SDR family NAD(P)-dependent oxidoreductase [Streptomyces sp. 8L]|uniref:SDR family NAD(P)-dependent oxidoreductase n=1 Tax=Streptomyces sp. 8L TaxID=2877242 RepID=UPI001CD7B365|nr:SDR family oxidoreductase [Streptomyces sp. 8L]MCA1218937.1 SDR family oxidoreductase [Streptomyces sp. 8L]